MSRTLVSLILAASMVSGVFFFTLNNSAEYDEDFYEYQPYLSYDLHIHELEIKRIEMCINDSDFRIKCCFDFDFPKSTLTCLGGDAGCLSDENTTYYHNLAI